MNCINCGQPTAFSSTGKCRKCNAPKWADQFFAQACCCIGPQNGEPVCPCRMRSVIKRNGRYIQSEVDLGPVIPSYNERDELKAENARLNAVLDYIGDPQNGMVDLAEYARNRGESDE